jgi:hypothetical protein
MKSAPLPQMTRICPWCADAVVVAFSEESLVRALVRHLENCPGEQSDEIC